MFHDSKRLDAFGPELDQWANGKFHIVTELDALYPAQLRELSDRPPVLYYEGRWPDPDLDLIGLVGTRHPSPYGRSVAEKLATELHIQGLGTVSGLAQGIDTCVHQAAWAVNGYTIAVLGNGLGHVFPKENALLQKRIAESGLVISEFPYDSPPQSAQFPRRNRIISGLSQGVVVIEAAIRSGASITARCAAEQGREVFAVPGRISDSTSAGCHRLIKQGAKLIEGVEDILDEFRPEPQRRQSEFEPEAESAEPSALTDLEVQILDELNAGELSADQILSRTRKPFDDVALTLLSLELKGMIRMLTGQRYART
jgi:DNA processing protein